MFSTIKILGKAKEKMYGVRDEYRVNGQAAQVLLRKTLPVVGCHVPFAFILAETPFRLGDICMASKPVLWLFFNVWFSLLSRRMEEI